MRACLSLFKLKTAEGFQYRIAGIAGAFTGVFWVLVEIVVYTVFYKYGQRSGSAMTASMTLEQLISYSWLTQIFFLMQPMSIDADILNKINNGDVGIELCRPMDLYFHWFAKTAAARLTPLFWRGSVTLIAGMLMPSGYRLSPPVSADGLGMMILSFGAAFLLCAAFGMLNCAIRLSVPWGDGPTYILMLIGGVLSGGYLPLQLWPDALQELLLYQPFAGYLDIPLRLYLGMIAPGEAWRFILLQLVWIVVFMTAGKIIMTSRLRRIVLQGG